MVSGFLSNPNNEFPLNFVPLRTLAAFIRCEGRWEPREAYLSAMKDWLPHFATIGQPVTEEDLILLGDCYYLPHQEGPEAEKLYENASRLLNQSPEVLKDEFPAFQRKSARLRELCVRITELRYRRLFYALSRRTWELREELDFLERYLTFRAGSAGRKEAYVPDSHLPGTYRGGLVPRLQRLMNRRSDGTYLPVPEPQNIALS
jgi:protein O-GlcNAcase/histone acetyltransferase